MRSASLLIISEIITGAAPKNKEVSVINLKEKGG
jgi:hypothetical protein